MSSAEQTHVFAADSLELPGAPFRGVCGFMLSITTFCTVCARTERPCTIAGERIDALQQLVGRAATSGPAMS